MEPQAKAPQSYNGHRLGCECPRCMEADMNRHLREVLGIDPARYQSSPYMVDTRPRPNGGNGAGKNAAPARPITTPQRKKIHVLAAQRDLRGLSQFYLGQMDRLGTLSAKQAGELIDALQECKPTKTRSASAAQIARLTREFANRDTAHLGPVLRDLVDKMSARVAANEPVSFDDAHAMLDVLNICPLKERSAPNLVGEGFYLHNNSVFRVRISKSTGRAWAARLDPDSGKFDYAKGVVFELKDSMRLTLEQAAKLGAKWHRCVVCGKDLTHPDSTRRGMGPYCANKL